MLCLALVNTILVSENVLLLVMQFIADSSSLVLHTVWGDKIHTLPVRCLLAGQ